MTTQELRELDAWIAEHVMGYKKWNNSPPFKKGCFCYDGYRILVATESISPKSTITKHWMPTENGSDAMDVLKKCAEKICDKWDESNCLQIQFWNGEWHVADVDDDSLPIKAETLELAICLFAKQLFSQTTK